MHDALYANPTTLRSISSNGPNQAIAYSAAEPGHAATALASSTSLLTEARLSDGRPALIIDSGSVSNLCGSDWAHEVVRNATQHNQTSTMHRRSQPIRLVSSGNDAPEVTHDLVLPTTIRRWDGTLSSSTIQLPVVNDSPLPGLLGLQALRDRHAILDTHTLRLYFCGPGEHDYLLSALPPGTESFQCELTQSGHIVLPCSEYVDANREENTAVSRQPTTGLDTDAEQDLSLEDTYSGA